MIRIRIRIMKKKFFKFILRMFKNINHLLGKVKILIVLETSIKKKELEFEFEFLPLGR